MNENNLEKEVSESKATKHDALRLLKQAKMSGVTLEEARKLLMEGAEIYSKFYSKSHAYGVFGYAAASTKKFDDIALELYCIAGSTDFALCGRAQIYEKRKDYAQAEKLYDEALKRANGSSAMVARYAKAFFEKIGKKEKAGEIISRFRELRIY